MVNDSSGLASSTPGTQLDPNTTANTKGSYEDFIDATSNTVQTSMMFIYINNTRTSATRTDGLVDISIAPSGGSDQIIIPDLLMGWKYAGDNQGALCIAVPMLIPGNVDIRGRAQSNTPTQKPNVRIKVFRSGKFLNHPCYVAADAYGVNSSGASVGTSVTPGASNAFGSWTNVGSTTSRDYRGVLCLIQGRMADTTEQSTRLYVEFGYSSTTLGGHKWRYIGEEASMGPGFIMPVAAPIPSGTQLQVRIKSNLGSPEACDAALYCFY